MDLGILEEKETESKGEQLVIRTKRDNLRRAAGFGYRPFIIYNVH